MAMHTAEQYATDRMNRLLTINEVAYRLAISRNSVYKLIRLGALSPSRVGERLRFRQEEIEDYLNRRRETVP